MTMKQRPRNFGGNGNRYSQIKRPYQVDDTTKKRAQRIIYNFIKILNDGKE
jgi:hypothetical protein